jgi:hypothetical protein
MIRETSQALSTRQYSYGCVVPEVRSQIGLALVSVLVARLSSAVQKVAQQSFGGVSAVLAVKAVDLLSLG